MIYPVDSAIHLLNNRGLVDYLFVTDLIKQVFHTVTCWLFCACFIWSSLLARSDVSEAVSASFSFLGTLSAARDSNDIDSMKCGAENDCCVCLILLSLWMSAEVSTSYEDDETFSLKTVPGLGEGCAPEGVRTVSRCSE